MGHYGNELADKLAKEAAGKDIISYNRVPICEIAQQLRETSLKKWQRQWDRTTKALTTKDFFPNIKDRLNTKIILTPNFTAFVTSHGKTKSYLHRFKIIESPDCPCGGWKPNGRPSCIRLHHSAGWKRTTHRQDLKTRQLASNQKSAGKQLYKTLHAVY